MTDALPRLFAEYAATSNVHNATYWWGSISDNVLVRNYLRSARRLVSTATNDGSDDEILLPVLYLYRHAIELQVKEAIYAAAALRRVSGDASSEVAYDALKKMLERQVRHDLHALATNLDLHLRALELEPLTEKCTLMLVLVADADVRGNAFRFKGQLPDVHHPIDLPRLVQSLEAAFKELDGVTEYLIVRGEQEADWRAEVQHIEEHLYDAY